MSPQSATQLALEALDERLVPAATLYNLTTQGAAALIPNSGVLVQQIDPQPTGTGYIRSFVRIQGAANGGGMQQGYNTDGRPLQFNENSSPQFTRSITLGQVPVVVIDGVAYREFLLDINQKASSPYLSLDQVQVYLGSTGNQTSLADLSKVFDLDADSGGDGVTIKLNANLNSGSGSGDMALLIPESYFTGQSANSFVYLYSLMGCQSGSTANGGFEEWSVKAVPPAQPPTGGALSGAVFEDSNGNGTMDTGEGLTGVLVTLQGTDYEGNTVVLTATTDADGVFTFNNVAAGTYSLIESELQLDTINGSSGTTGGNADFGSDQFLDITLNDGDNGTGYLFQVVYAE